MTRLSIRVGVLLVFALSLASAAAETVTGTWNCVAKAPGRPDMEFRLNLKQDGKEVTGTGSRADGSASIQRGSFENGKLRIQIDADNGTYDMEGTVSRNKITGTLTHTSGNKASWEGTREGASSGSSKISASTIEGAWQTDQYTVEFKQEGDKLTGKVVMPDGQNIPMTKASFADNVVRFTVSSPDGSYEAEARLDGDKLMGTYATPGGVKRNWEANRL